MKRVPGTVRFLAFLFAAALVVAAASPLAAQEATAAAPVVVVDTAATPVGQPATVLPGPRERAEFASMPSYGENRAPAPMHRDNTTITVSTLVLVLCVIIVVLLVK